MSIDRVDFPNKSIEIIKILKNRVPQTINEINRLLKLEEEELRNAIHVLRKYGIVKSSFKHSLEAKYYLFSHGPEMKTMIYLIKDKLNSKNRKSFFKFNILLIIVWILNFTLILVFMLSLVLFL